MTLPIVDVETAPDPAVLPLIQDELDAMTAPATYKDPEKIASYVAQKRAERIAKCATNIDELRIVAIGTSDSLWLCKSARQERDALEWLWTLARDWQRDMHQSGGDYLACGFFVKTFDFPALIRRSQILGVEVPKNLVRLGRYLGNVLDLADVLTWNRVTSQYPRRLEFYARRFGIVSADEPYSTGAEVSAWVEQGDWQAIEDHLRQDLNVTRKLAERLGVL